jgi:hypothetical protein
MKYRPLDVKQSIEHSDKYLVEFTPAYAVI